jgi:hypothetical protein
MHVELMVHLVLRRLALRSVQRGRRVLLLLGRLHPLSDAVKGNARRSGRALIVVACVATGCGRPPISSGVLVNEVSVEKTLVEPALNGASTRARRQADVLGDSDLETLVALPRGEGIEVLDRLGRRLSVVSAPGYVTDFAALPTSSADKQDLVLYLYPNDSGGGTFTVLTPSQKPLASWREPLPPGGFAVGRWDGRDAIIYLRSGSLVMRSPEGQELIEVAVPASDPYDVRDAITVGPRTVVLASGGGYTPFHMVIVLEADGTLVFAEVAPDQASALESTGAGAFTVRTRSGGWRYSLPEVPVP